jgi:HD superfamily phosphohydrolase
MKPRDDFQRFGIQAGNLLLGRDRDLDLIGACVEEGRQMVLVGAPGVGKTSLAIELLRRLADANWLTAMIPAAQVATIDDLAQLIAAQVVRALDASSGAVKDTTEALSTSDIEPDRQLSLAFELLSLAAAEQGKAVLVVDDVDALFANSRSADLGEIFGRKLRSMLQHAKCLSTIFLTRSDAVVREVFESRDAPLFGMTTTYRVEPFSSAASLSLMREIVEANGLQITEQALSRMQVSCGGLPLLLRMVSGAVVSSARTLDLSTIDLALAEGALAQAKDDNELVIAERLDAIRRSHRLGLDVARRLARGESPYAGEQLPNNVTRVLKNLERLGLASRPKPRKWLLTDPFLAEALRDFNPQSLAANTLTTVDESPRNLPPPDRCVRYLRNESIWNLSTHWFEPETVFRDAVYGDIRVTHLEHEILESPEFQRLRRVRQLGLAHLVYPGATHTRFEHSLGVLALSSSMIGAVLSHDAGRVSGERGDIDLNRQLEVISLTRVAGLVHDLATVPCASALEANVSPPFESYGERLKKLWLAVVTDIESRNPIKGELAPLTEGRFFNSLLHACRGEVEKEVEYPFVRDLIQGPISADSFDFTARDRRALGLNATYIASLASGMRIVDRSNDAAAFDQHIAIDLASERDESIKTQMLQHLYSLCEHSEFILNHTKARAADAMLVGAVSRWQRLRRLSGEDNGAEGEVRFLELGDDGLLEYLRSFARSAAPGPEAVGEARELEAVGHLAEGILNRRLYKRVGCVRGQPHLAPQLIEEFGDARTWHYLEAEAAKAAGILDSGRVLLLVPPSPHTKFEEILVCDEDGVGRAWDGDDPLSNAIRELDARLRNQWEISVFVAPTVRAEETARVLDWLGSRLRLRWETTYARREVSSDDGADLPSSTSAGGPSD